MLVRTLDLSRLILSVSRRVKARGGGRLLMKLDIEGAEYEVVARLALSRALCALDTVTLEWHARYFGFDETSRVAQGLNLTSGTSGRSMLRQWVLRTQEAVVEAAAACEGTQVRVLDDESFMHDQRPWPSSGTVCEAAAAPEPYRRRSKGELGLLPQWQRFWADMYDDFEAVGMGWFAYVLAMLILCGCTCCCYNLAEVAESLSKEEEEEEEEAHAKGPARRSGRADASGSRVVLKRTDVVWAASSSDEDAEAEDTNVSALARAYRIAA